MLARLIALADLRGPWRWMPLVVVTLIMLWAGLDPKGYRFRNEVEWVKEGGGLRFGRFARVETEPFLSREQAEALNQNGYALELAVEPSPDPRGVFRVLAFFQSDNDRSQLVIGQWHEQLIVMNGNDYSHRRGEPRVAADMTKFSKRPLRLTINSTPAGTSLYLNGEPVATSTKLHLTLPSEPRRARLLLGNTASASRPWLGVIRFVSLLPRSLNADEIASRWRAPGGLPISTPDALLLYRFEEAGGRTIRNHGSLAAPLKIPSPLHAPGHRFLQWSAADTRPSLSLMLDTVVNFVGFMPLGAAIMIALRSPHRSRCRTILATALIGFVLSLAIELTQAWMPSRDSSLRDLLLNTAGAPVGAGVWLWARQRLGRFLSDELTEL